MPSAENQIKKRAVYRAGAIASAAATGFPTLFSHQACGISVCHRISPRGFLTVVWHSPSAAWLSRRSSPCGFLTVVRLLVALVGHRPGVVHAAFSRSQGAGILVPRDARAGMSARIPTLATHPSRCPCLDCSVSNSLGCLTMCSGK